MIYLKNNSIIAGGVVNPDGMIKINSADVNNRKLCDLCQAIYYVWFLARSYKVKKTKDK